MLKRQDPAGMDETQLEVQTKFVPTPERISQYLEVNQDNVSAQMASVEGREELYRSLLEHEEDLRTIDPDFDPAELKEQLDLAGETLQEKQHFMEDMQQPEKKNVFRRAWEKVKGFAKKHPVVTTLLVLALAAGGIAAGFYFTGHWELLMTKVGLSKILGGAEAASELIPPTPATPPLPGGGVFEVPPPPSSPGLGGVT